MDNSEWVGVCLGRGYSLEQVQNICREVRALFITNLYPQGDRNKKAQVKVTRDSFGQYTIYLNQQALLFLLLFCKDIPGPNRKQATPECPPEVPDFLRWDSHADSGSKSE